jgi:hypothetical protein
MLLFNLLTGCTTKITTSSENEDTNFLSEEKIHFGAIPLDSSHFENINIRWGDGTLFIVNDTEIIDQYFNLISGETFKILAGGEDRTGFLYYIKLGDTSINNDGIMNGDYELEDMTVLSDIEKLLLDYLPNYNGGQLEFQSDLMPDSNLYIVVEVEKCSDGKLYFKKYQNDYGFENGTTSCDGTFNSGEIVEIKTDGRLPEGNDIEIVAYSINKTE